MGLAAGLLWVAALQGRFGVILWLLGSGSLLVVTALYALGLRRRTWAGLDTVEQRKFALGLGSVVLVVGMVAAVVSTPQPVAGRISADAEGLQPRPDLFALPTTPAPGSVLQVPLPFGSGQEATEDSADGFGSYALLGEISQGEPEALLTGTPCAAAGSSRTQGQTEYRCTYNLGGNLTWLDAASARQLERAAASERAEAVRQEERARQAAEDARLEQEEAQQRAAEEQGSAAGDAPAPQPPAQPNPPPPPANNPQPPRAEPPVGPPVEPPPEPPTEPPTPPPSPDPTVPPPDPPTPPGPPDPPLPGTPDPDIPVIPPEFPVPPSPPTRERPVEPSSSFAPSAAPTATEAAAEQVLPVAR